MLSFAASAAVAKNVSRRQYRRAAAAAGAAATVMMLSSMHRQQRQLLEEEKSLRQEEEEEQDHKEEDRLLLLMSHHRNRNKTSSHDNKKNGGRRFTTMTMMLPMMGNVTRCEAAIARGPVVPEGAPGSQVRRILQVGGGTKPPTIRLRRQKTADHLRETATTQLRLQDKYQVEWSNPLGEGSYGKVYPATTRRRSNNNKGEEKVAVKAIPKSYTDNDTFQREMDALLLLREYGGHPNICSMRENFDEDNNYYIVMDLVSGNEMFDILIANGAYSEADAAYHIQNTASALAFMHGVGITHTDLKPENLMLDDHLAIVKLVDFGCANLINNNNDDYDDSHPTTTSTKPTTKPWMGSSTGTRAYTPPEVLKQIKMEEEEEANNNGSCHRCHRRHRPPPKIHPSFDMWSLGCVVYIMLVGFHPFDRDCSSSDEEIEARILSGEKPPLRGSEHTEHLSEDALQLIEGLLEWDPEKRLTAEQVLQNRWVQGLTASSKKIPESDQRLSTYRKYKTKVGSAFFKALLSQSDNIRHSTKSGDRTSLLENAFRQLDTDNDGHFVIKGDDNDDSAGDEGADTAQLSFLDVSSLLSENMMNRNFPKGHIIYNEGDHGDSIFLIDSGKVECTNTIDGFKKLRGPGEILGVSALTDASQTYETTSRCITPVRVIEISRELYNKYVASDLESELSMAENTKHRKRERASALLRMQTESSRKRQYAKGSTIFQAGEEGDKLIIVEDGEVNMSVRGHSVRSLQPGEVAGEHAAFFGGKPYNVTARCVSNTCTVSALSSNAMHQAFAKDPPLKEAFRDLMLRRDFKKAICAETKRPFPTTEMAIREAFHSLDVDSSGEISLENLQEVVHRFDPTYSEADINDMLHSLDLNKSGNLTWPEFVRIFSMDKEA